MIREQEPDRASGTEENGQDLGLSEQESEMSSRVNGQ